MSANWTFLTNHAHVWLSLARDPDQRLRDLADAVGITERAVHRIVHDLEEAGYLEIQHLGRRNHYSVNVDLPMRHPVEAGATVRDLMVMVSPPIP